MREPIENECSEPYREKPKRTYGIERKYIGDRSCFSNRFLKKGWHKYRRYRSEKSRDDAMEALQKYQHTQAYGWKYLYRVEAEPKTRK